MVKLRVKLRNLKPEAAVHGVVPDSVVLVVNIDWHESNAMTLVNRLPDGRIADEMLYRDDRARLDFAE